MTDINELAQRMSIERIKQIARGGTPIVGEKERLAITALYFSEQLKIATDAFQAAGLAQLAAEEALEKAKDKIIELQQKCEIDQRTHEIIDLKERIENLESFRTAYMEWGDKTDWMQADKRFDAMKPWGKHRADVLKEYIDKLESRTVTVKLPEITTITSRYSDEEWHYYSVEDIQNMLSAAGIQIQGGE